MPITAQRMGRLVVLESPYRGLTPQDTAENVRYAKLCLMDSLRRGEAPIASHLLWTQEGILDDAKPEERAAGIAAGHSWIPRAAAVVVYCDRGVSDGMIAGCEVAAAAGIPIELRRLPKPKPD